jgi:hypothetical protein
MTVSLVNSNISSDTYWSSGSDVGCLGKHAWCSASKMFRNATWSANNFIADATKKCVTVSLNRSVATLAKDQCSFLRNFICEVPLDFVIWKCSKLFKFYAGSRHLNSHD